MGQSAKVSPADVRSVANQHIAKAKDDIAAALAKFEATADGENGFGAFEAGTELAGLHSSVKSVFTQTVTGVSTDLTTYHQNLIAGADAWEAADEHSADRSRALTERLSAAASQPLATEDNFDRSRLEAGERLGLGDTLADHAPDPSAAQSGPGGEARQESGDRLSTGETLAHNGDGSGSRPDHPGDRY